HTAWMSTGRSPKDWYIRTRKAVTFRRLQRSLAPTVTRAAHPSGPSATASSGETKVWQETRDDVEGHLERTYAHQRPAPVGIRRRSEEDTDDARTRAGRERRFRAAPQVNAARQARPSHRPTRWLRADDPDGARPGLRSTSLRPAAV